MSGTNQKSFQLICIVHKLIEDHPCGYISQTGLNLAVSTESKILPLSIFGYSYYINLLNAMGNIKFNCKFTSFFKNCHDNVVSKVTMLGQSPLSEELCS